MIITRRKLLKSAVAIGALAGASHFPMPAIAQNKAVKLGYVSPQTDRSPPSRKPTPS